MTKTTVVNIYKNKYDVYIGRAGRGYDGYFGNPFSITNTCSRSDCISKFEKYFYERIKKDPIFAKRIQSLKGKVLGCFCKPLSCHGDIIAEYLNEC